MGEDKFRKSVWSVFQNRWVRFVLLIGVLVGAGFLVYELRNILVPFGLAVVAAYIFNPVVTWIQAKLKWSRLAAVVVLVSVLTVVVVGALGFGLYYAVVSVQKMAPVAQRAIEQSAQGEGLWGDVQRAVRTAPNELRAELEKLVKSLPDVVRQHFRSITGSVLKGVGAVVRALLGFVLSSFNFVLFFVVTAYILIDLPAWRDRAADVLPNRYRHDIIRIAVAIDRDVHAFFRGQVLVALALGAIYSVGLLICRLDFALLIGVVAGLANVVPYLGIAVGLVPALLLALVPYGGLLKPIGVAAVFVIGQNIEGFYLTPRIVGKNVGLSPVAVILAIMVFGQLFGFLGIIFAVPLAAAVKVLSGELMSYYKSLQAPDDAPEADPI